MAVVPVRMKLVLSLSSIQELYHRTESVCLMENVNDSYVSIVTSAVIIEHASLCRFHYLHAKYMCFAIGTPSLATR